ncbi:MAG: hypothetical protein COA44_05505 [Arcobacter sp.]|nr:MAG: hypothetical protein COA44_05505 [Arcobacter sp.]
MKYFNLLLILVVSTNLQAGWQDLVGSFVDKNTKSKNTSASTSSLQEQALKLALKQGVNYAVKSLGKKNAYYKDKRVKIPLPQSVANMEPIIRNSGGDKYIEELIISMNNAATSAAPKTVDIFFSSIKKMSIKDAQEILSSDDEALSRYFKNSSYNDLEKLIKPIVKKMMDENKVSYYYTKVRSSYEDNKKSIPYHDALLKTGSSFGLDKYAPPKDLDNYVTRKAIDGLFIKISEEEKKIRDNPSIQKTKIIRDVFSLI